MQEIINRRIETGYSSSHVLNLSQHFEQLSELYALIYNHWEDEQQQEYYDQMKSYQDDSDPHEEYMREEERNKMFPYYKFIEQLIETKRRKISHILNI